MHSSAFIASPTEYVHFIFNHTGGVEITILRWFALEIVEILLGIAYRGPEL